MSNKIKYYITVNKTTVVLNKHKKFFELLPDFKTLREHIVAQIQEYELKKIEFTQDTPIPTQIEGSKSFPSFELEPMELSINSKYFDEVLSDICSIACVKSNKRTYLSLRELPIYCNLVPAKVLVIKRNDLKEEESNEEV